ncbi:CBM96 family carbohydrate-binding protein [Sinomicrobium soli]|uniref:CBM96 family carbohydrate-binding protein n=1 Tax=Sinomicrobium sp. N-1-3-6 TaxID=2219864 RepID=UPI000DCB64EB|nr:DNRLRE domain-containing protein [Sinomicrobium sp. N-1-3-6]RAV30864.1 hypothetical protein DN748_00985 [Sinomicrobium sp. N-1-3-6]
MQNHNILIRFLGICLTVAITTASCEIQKDFEYQKSGTDGKLEVSAWEFIQENDSLEYLEQAIVLAELQELYEGEEVRTFITPTNASFKTYLADNSYSSMEEVPLPILRNILRYHIVNDKVHFGDPELFENNKPIAYDTENGQLMYLSHNNNFMGLINQGTNVQWQITTSNLEPLNGVLHIVNSIVYFSAPAGDTNAPDPTLVRDTIFPVYDTYVNGGAQSGANFGNNPLLKVKNVSGDGDYDRKAFLMFDLDDFDREGIITDIQLEIAVSFTHAKGVALDVYQTPDTSWNEMGLTFDSAVFPQDGPIASITTTKVSSFKFNLTDFYKDNQELGRLSLMLDGEAGTDETDDLASKEHADLHPPMLVATLASGQNTLELSTHEDINVENGETTVWNNDILEITGATAADIIYTVEAAPANGWLIKGANILRAGDQFTQLDVELMNLLYIHNGEGGSEDTVMLSAKDKTGSAIEEITVEINVQ